MPNIAPPRNVIYYNSNSDNGSTTSLSDIASSGYTDVIIGFLVPMKNPDGSWFVNPPGSGGDGGGAGQSIILQLSAPDDVNLNDLTNVRNLQNQGINVLISVGGAAGWFSQNASPQNPYVNYAEFVEGMALQIVDFVAGFGFNGVDIDYEDDSGFDGTGGYNGVQFLVELTQNLSARLPSRIITHAPQTPYWDPTQFPASGATAPYTQIWQQVGNQITWINNQFYNNSTYDADAATKRNWYQQIAAITGPQNLLMGVILDSNATGGPAGEGYISIGDMIDNVITPLQTHYRTDPEGPGEPTTTVFGGAMGWEFIYDVEYQGGTWGSQLSQALGPPIFGLTGPPPGPTVPTSGSWNVNDLTAATNGQTAAGNPNGYVYDAQNMMHVVYRGIDGHIYDLWWQNGWNINDLTAATNAQKAAGDPNGFMFDAQGTWTQHVVYLGTDNHIYELYWENGWNVNDLTAATNAVAAAGNPSGYADDTNSMMHVSYRGIDGHIYDLWWQNGWNVNDLTAATGAQTAAADPNGFMFDAQGQQHVVYLGTDDHIYDLWWQNGWNVNDLTAATNAVTSAGNPSGYVYEAANMMHVVYRGIDGHIYDLWWQNGWNVNDLTAATGAPAAAGDPNGFMFDAQGTQHVVYYGTDGDLHELYWESGWNVNDLTAATSAPAAAGNPNGFVFPSQEEMHVVYLGTDSHIYDFWWAPS